MRHRKKGRKLGRTASHRRALLRNLANQLIEYKEIRTTTAKAKEARSVVDRLITYAKKGSLHHRRLAFSFLRQKSSVKMLFDEIAPTYEERQGGYTRVIKLGRRDGDGAHLSLLQLVGFEKLVETEKSDKKKKSKRKTGDKEKKTTVTQESKEEMKTETIKEGEEISKKSQSPDSDAEKKIKEESNSGKIESDKTEVTEEEPGSDEDKTADAGSPSPEQNVEKKDDTGKK